jgi:orotidine-5'-phosphate decarboxylase
MKTDAFADRMAYAVRQRGPLCVGIDPRWDMLPEELTRKHTIDGVPNVAAAFAEFGQAVLELVAPYCACVKPQAAFFENIRWDGARVLGELLADATERGLPTILDAKRGDISSTATAYAQSAFQQFNADSVTVNPYLGADSIEPFLSEARSQQRQRGVFVLVRTSNPGAGLFQNLLCDGKPLYRVVGEEVAKWNDGRLGECRLGDVGAVVGATNPNELVELRAAMPRVWFLVPGYGAQGGSAAAVKAAYLPNGLGAVVNSSRGITFPYHTSDANWKSKIIDAAKKAQAELR